MSLGGADWFSASLMAASLLFLSSSSKSILALACSNGDGQGTNSTVLYVWRLHGLRGEAGRVPRQAQKRLGYPPSKLRCLEFHQQLLWMGPRLFQRPALFCVGASSAESAGGWMCVALVCV